MTVAKLSPSIMCANVFSLGETLEVFDRYPEAIPYLHVDVMDGYFVPNLMIGTDLLKQVRKRSKTPLDVHLMVKDPGVKFPWFDFQPSERVAVHVEGTSNLLKDVLEVRRLGCKAIVAINPGTSITSIEEVLRFVDGVLVMAINPGFAGQQMVPGIPDKIRRLRTLLFERGLEKQVDIEVDGHVTRENAKELYDSGASLLVAGTSLLFNKLSLEDNVDAYLKLCW